MLRTNTALWRIAFLSGLGVLPGACGGDAESALLPPGTASSGQASSSTPEDGVLPSPSTQTDTTATQQPSPSGPDAAGTPCADSVPYLVLGVDTGLERCGDGRLHRPAQAQCSSKVPRPDPSPDLPAGPDAGCTRDSDCTDAPFGYCSTASLFGGGPAYPHCEYGCVQDSDCGAGYLCQCGDPVGDCIPSNCRIDADCGSGFLCAQAVRDLGPIAAGCGFEPEFFCEKPADECRVYSDCPPGPNGSYCGATEAARVCVEMGAGSCGRPFLIDGSARLASVQRSQAWLGADLSPDCSALTSAERAELAHAWTELGLMEHASVAAFARFTLQLLNVGAPAELIEQSQQALADELLHARLCFSLASQYAGDALGPGPLPTAGALDLSALEDIVALTLHEGCVGETIAALEASEALALASDPAVRQVLARIEADEQRHAALAWRFVRWALQHGGPRVQQRVQRELAELLVPAAPERPGVERHGAAAAHGILSAAQRAELRDAALRSVVLPCARALLPAARPALLSMNI